MRSSECHSIWIYFFACLGIRLPSQQWVGSDAWRRLALFFVFFPVLYLFPFFSNAAFSVAVRRLAASLKYPVCALAGSVVDRATEFQWRRLDTGHCHHQRHVNTVCLSAVPGVSSHRHLLGRHHHYLRHLQEQQQQRAIYCTQFGWFVLGVNKSPWHVIQVCCRRLFSSRMSVNQANRTETIRSRVGRVVCS